MSRAESIDPVANPSGTERGVSVAPTISTGWVGRWVDPERPLDEDLSREAIEQAEVARLLNDLAIVLYASQMPRRLGGDASSMELAEDKRRCRRVGWALRQALRQWTERIELPEVTEHIRVSGAGLDWLVFEEKHMAVLTERTKRAATWAMRQGQRKWGASIVTKLENERRWVTHSLR